MSDPALRIGSSLYDHTRALFDGSAGFPGLDVTMGTAATLPEIFEGLVHGEYDAAEFGLTFYLRTLDAGAPFVALPVFPVRVFRHSSVFVNAASGIERPEDLVGRTIGEMGIYGQDPGVWIKGVFSDEYGFAPEKNRWVIGGLDRPGPPFDFVPRPHPADVEVTVAPEGRSLSGMLEAGEIDALFTANVPQCVLDGTPHVRRLFPDFETAERDYHRRTGIFPIMHTVAVRRDVLDAHPELARSIYQGFLDAKELAADFYRRGRRLYQAPTMLPWATALVERNREEFPEDWWPYGVGANRTTLDTFLRYHHEQGLSARRHTVEEIFAPSLLDT